jgi:hypothetical protein
MGTAIMIHPPFEGIRVSDLGTSRFSVTFNANETIATLFFESLEAIEAFCFAILEAKSKVEVKKAPVYVQEDWEAKEGNSASHI